MNEVLRVFKDQTNKKLFKRIFLNSLPLAFAGLLAVLMGFIDAFFLSNYSLEAFKALSLVIPVLGIVGSIGIAIGAALINAIANFEKEGKKEVVYFSTVLLLVVCYILIVGVVIYLHDGFLVFNDLVLEVNKLIKDYFTQYWFAIIPFYFLVLILNITIQYLSFRDNNREIISILLIVVFLNLLFNPLLIFYFNLGVRGAAWASILSLLCGILYFSARDNRFTKLVKLIRQASVHFKTLLPILKEQSKVAVSVFLAIAIFMTGGIFFNQLAIKQGSEFLALIGLIEQLKLFMIFPTRGVTGSFLIQFEKAIADKDTESYWKIYWIGTLIIGLICLVEGILIFIFSDALLALFNIEAESSKQLFEVLLTSLYIYFLVNIIARCSQVGFITLGKSYLLFLQSLFAILFGYGCTYYLISHYGNEWFVDGQSIGGFIATTFFLVVFVVMLNKKKKTDRLAKNKTAS